MTSKNRGWQKKAADKLVIANVTMTTLLQESLEVPTDSELDRLSVQQIYLSLVAYVAGLADSGVSHSINELIELVEDAYRGTTYHSGVLTDDAYDAVQRFITSALCSL